ncbi:MAG: STAS domain-containing protein [Acidobacteriota bacterium]|nr:STAS domain-containing protein [Acidobacteriota bacterium]
MAAQIKWSRREGILIAAPIGRIDGNNYIEVQNALESGIDPDERAMILDFAQLGYISSAGLRVCLIIAKKFNPAGKAFGICNLSDSIREIVTVSGFHGIMSIYDSQSAAIEAITGKAGGGEEEAGQASATIPIRTSVDFDIVGENIQHIANFTIEKYEYQNDRSLSLKEREAVVAGITNALWQYIERLKTRRKQLLTEMFKSAESVLDEVVAKADK